MVLIPADFLLDFIEKDHSVITYTPNQGLYFRCNTHSHRLYSTVEGWLKMC